LSKFNNQNIIVLLTINELMSH